MDVLGHFRPVFSGWTLTIVLLAIAYALVILPYKTEKDADLCSLSIQPTFTLYSKRVVTPKGVIPAAVEVGSGRITAVTKRAAPPEASHTRYVVDLGNAVLSPGLVDVHVHMNEPGRADWEGVETATHAAAAGGVTTVVDMPLNSNPVTATPETLALKLEATAGKIMVDVGFWGGLVPENAANATLLEELLRAGALGLKAALPILAKYGRPLYIHAEVPLAVAVGAEEEGEAADPRKYDTYLRTRPASWEQAAIQQVVEVAQGTAAGGPYEGAKMHIAHLGDAGSLEMIQGAKEAGADLSVETCPHYLAFSSERIEDGQTHFKCAPPLRSESNRQSLWQALKDGRIDLLSSDHSPAPPELKRLEEGNFLEAWGGISGLQFSLPATWTFGRDHGISLRQLADWWSARPAALANLAQKGAIEVGKDADFVVWDPEASFKVDETFTIHHKHQVTPYAGLQLYGQVLRTYVRGMLVYHNEMHAPKACGKQLLSHF